MGSLAAVGAVIEFVCSATHNVTLFKKNIISLGGGCGARLSDIIVVAVAKAKAYSS